MELPGHYSHVFPERMAKFEELEKPERSLTFYTDKVVVCNGCGACFSLLTEPLPHAPRH